MKILLVLYIALLSSCSTPPKDLNPKSFIYNAERQTSENIRDLMSALTEQGFQIRSHDKSIGSLTTHQRSYSVTNSLTSVEKLLVTINVHQERANLKLTMAYLCSRNGKRSICSQSDTEIMNQVQKIQRQIDRAATKNIR